MKKIYTALLSVILILTIVSFPARADYDEEISAESAILYCCNTGDVLYEKDADTERLIASITKIMTAIVIIENCDLDDIIRPKPEWCAVEGSSMYLDYNKSYTVRDILKGMLLVSGNDAATALACYYAGDERSFSAKMNEKAKELGLEHSSFRNPHGLDDEEHYSTARDMAVLAAYCMENEEFKSIVQTYSETVDVNTYYNHNKLLISYRGCIGVKTGYTIAAGRTLISCAERNGMRLVCVTLSAPDDWNDHKKLLDHGFDNYNIICYSKDSLKFLLPVYSSVKGYAYASLDEELVLLCRKTDKIDVQTELPKLLFAGGLKNQTIGKLGIFINDTLAIEVKLVYTDDIPVNTNNRLTAAEQIKRIYTLLSRTIYIS